MPTKAKRKPKHQIHAKDIPKEEQLLVSSAKTRDEIWGRSVGKFGGRTPEVYEKHLRQMNKMDLFQECLRVGRAPNDNRELMIERLIKDCRQELAAAATQHTIRAQPIHMDERGLETLRRLSNGF